MRWPLRQKADGSGEEIDQEAVNALVDYAIAHGVNYFDVAPVYVRGLSEQATGLALSRHSRDKYLSPRSFQPIVLYRNGVLLRAPRACSNSR